MAALIGNWWTFTKERFSLPSHIPMVALFSLGNMAMAERLMGEAVSFARYGALFALAFSFFFRLRCFDEIKDYEVDLKVNPTRPLARGVLTIQQVKIMIAALCVFEAIVAGFIGQGPLVVHAIAIGYSFLMYNEFFIGKYLRPHLTTYAVTHTFVSMLLGWSLAAQTLGTMTPEVWQKLILMGPVNWMLFNLFEFARKTFAPEEERPTVDSYSSLFGVWGASALSLSQVAIALIVLHCMPLPGFNIQLACAAIPILASAWFCWKKNRSSAGLFRGVTGAYLLIFYVVLSLQGLLL